jgi:ABC-type uncharacterized transport system substrate-binding protein
MKRRKFLGLVGAAAAWPTVARAQQPAMPVIGMLSASSPSSREHLVTAFQRGVREGGYVEDQTVAIEYQWAENQYDRLPRLAANLVHRRVAVIAATDTPSAIAAKSTTSAVPVVFASGSDPVREGLVASLNRPGGNVTGITFLTSELGAKLLELLLELVPEAVRIAALVDPSWPSTGPFVEDVRAAASSMKKHIEVLPATTGSELEAVFARFAQKPVDALLVGGSALTNNRRVQIATLAHDLYPARKCLCWRLDELRGEHHRGAPPGRYLYHPGSERSEASRFAGHAVDQIRVRDQPQHGQGIWSDRSVWPAGDRRRGN